MRSAPSDGINRMKRDRMKGREGRGGRRKGGGGLGEKEGEED